MAVDSPMELLLPDEPRYAHPFALRRAEVTQSAFCIHYRDGASNVSQESFA
jgi:hypothetical protein